MPMVRGLGRGGWSALPWTKKPNFNRDCCRESTGKTPTGKTIDRSFEFILVPHFQGFPEEFCFKQTVFRWVSRGLIPIH